MTTTIVSALCLGCGHETTDETDLELWNGYGDCPKCYASHAIWSLDSGRITDVFADQEAGVLTETTVREPFAATPTV